jgi:hypothetical protein
VSFDLLAFLILSVLTLAAGAVLGRRLNWLPSRLLLLALFLRIVGSTVRLEVLQRFYRGVGDAVAYYQTGLQLSGSLAGARLSVLSRSYWVVPGTTWWGTEFLNHLSAIVLSVIGPTMRGEFLTFALMSFLGLYLIVAAFRSVGGTERGATFAAWIWCWPSLWFWPASVGKEAVLILGIGLLTFGYAGDGRRFRWLPLVAGFGLTFAIRPHVAAVLALSVLAAYWLGSWTRFTLRRFTESLVALAIAIAALQGMAHQFGLDLTDAEGVQEFVEFRSGQTERGGSNIGPAPSGLAGISMAFVNIWMRPFPWDVHNATALVAAAEVLFFWGLVWYRRGAVLLALKHWRQHRLLRFAVPLLLAYTLMIGLTFSNLGIIARQRTPVSPFMLMLVLAAPATENVAAQRRAQGQVALNRQPVGT